MPSCLGSESFKINAMKTIVHLFLMMVLGITVSAKPVKNELIQKLSRVNIQWQKQNNVQNVSLSREPQNFNEWISTHLNLVEQTLRLHDIQHLSSEQQSKRFQLLDELKHYAAAGVFPINNYLPYQKPVFIDRIGTHCAVGHLMMQSGNDDLARRIDANEKFAYIHEIKTHGVEKWATEHGFTVDELAWIQPGYPPQSNAFDLNGGLNGTVLATAFQENDQTIYVAGGFSGSNSGINASNIIAWISGFAGYDWMSLGIGTNDTIRTLLLHDNQLYIGGDFTLSEGETAPHVAMYDITTGSWSAMGALDGDVHALAVYNDTIYAGGKFTGLLARWNGSAWEDVAQGFIYGEGVRTLEVWNNKLVMGGNFSLITGAPRFHVATYDGVYMSSLGFGTPTPVNDFAIHNESLYAACDMIVGSDTCALALFNEENDGNWETLIGAAPGMEDGFWGNGIYSIASDGYNLLCGGDFFCTSLMTYGNNLMAYQRFQDIGGSYYNSYNPLLVPDGPIRNISLHNNQLYFAGDFNVNLFTDTLGHIGYLDYVLNIQTPSRENASIISARPVPAVNELYYSLETQGEPVTLSLYTLEGKEVYMQTNATTSGTIPVTQLSNGVYILKAQSAKFQSSHKIVVGH
jgi:hypothetical protein